MLKRKKILSKLLATTMVLTSFTVNASAAEVNSDTILGGSNRFETAIKISENGWSTSDRAVLINGEKGLVDALTATPYAYTKNAPILITASGKLTPATANRLTKMGVKNVDVVGGTNSVSEGVVTELKNKGITVNRISGASRYDTSLAVAKEIDKIQDVAQIAVVNGDKGIPDAVSVAAPAASKKMPILLAENNGLNAASKKFVDGEGVTKSYVIGSTNSVSDGVMNSLPGTKTRLGGANRHDTNAAVIKEFYTATSLSNIYVAKSGMVKSKDEIVDALSAGVLAAKNGNPIVLVGNNIETSQQSLLASKKFTKMTQIGMGVPANSVNQIKATQADEESVVSSVSAVNYNTLKITGKLLDKLTTGSFSISGNSVSSYSPNTAGTEATLVFNSAFGANNTLSVNSNLGKATSHNFTYNTNVSSVQASTKEVAEGSSATLELTVNGNDKKSLRELKEQGWTIEFISKSDIFYDVEASKDGEFISENGRLKTTLKAGETHNYKVIIKNGNTKYESTLTAFEVVDKAAAYESIVSSKFDLTITTANSKPINTDVNTITRGESAVINQIEVKDSLGNTKKVDIKEFDITSNNKGVLDIQNGNTLVTMGGEATVTITVKKGNLSKNFSVVVKPAENRKFDSVTLSKSTIKLAKGATGKVDVRLLDQFGAPWEDDTKLTDEKVMLDKNQIATISENQEAGSNLRTLTITASSDNAGENGRVKIAKSELRVDISANNEATYYEFDVLEGGSKNIDVYTPNNNNYEKEVVLGINGLTTSNGYSTGAIDLSKVKFSDSIPTKESDFDSYEYIVAPSVKDTVNLDFKKDASLNKIAIKVKALKKGTPTLYIYPKAVATATSATSKGSIGLSVADTTPKLTNLDFEYVGDIKEATSFDLMSKLFDIREVGTGQNLKKIINNIKVEGVANEVLVNNVGNKFKLYANNTSTPIADIEITNTSGASIVNGELTASKGNKDGTIVINVYKTGESKVFKQKLISVNIK
ncbi:cell wall-binding repeat-containing protein [Metaclostridioides mangenotii]|uniref:cell wall-binding repeat-containing protein n=1 Tax=Metaclostridioides mangenotii TaxID=1540 RepID=UPI0004ADDF53|nr:cell wall-binding repeat-containing protein [Clostridioides mangenotii]